MTAIENPLLKKALKDYADAPTEATQVEFIRQLNAASYLVPVILGGTPPVQGEDGKMAFTEGATIQFLYAVNENKEAFLIGFTDWEEVAAWTKEKTNTMVLPLADIHALLARTTEYKGFVLNPAGRKWGFSPEQVKNVIEDGLILARQS